MGIILRMILIFIFFDLAISQNKYQFATYIDSIYDGKKVSFLYDDAWMLLYGQENDYLGVYSTFNFSQIFLIDKRQMNYITFFENEQQQKSYLSGNIKGRI